mgnify:CR=1 FL=1
MRPLSNDEKAGLLATATVHLAVLVILLATGLGYSLSKENTFVLDFSKYEEMERIQEEIEKLQKEAEFQQAISEKLERDLASAPSVRGVAVNRAALKDDRGTDAEQLYKDAERLQQELANGFTVNEDDVASPAPERREQPEEKEESVYSGPSVISYYLEGRKASRLPIPAYRCMGGGEVTVLISVDPTGTVVAAKVDESCSSSDGCLRAFAIRAARISKFSASPDAPPKQNGNIVYQFIAQ